MDRNGTLTPDDVTMYSGKYVWWRCSKETCGYIWKIAVSHRTRGDGCPACSGRVLSDKNRFSIICPDISKEWDYDRNDKTPEEFSIGSSKKVWWRCNKCGYRWEAIIYNRRRGKGCPRCSNRVIDETNSLEALYPEIAKEWDYTKNKKFTPGKISYGSEQKVWWLCQDCGFSWKTAPNNRTYNKSGCPKCAKNHISGVSQEWLDSLNVRIREHYIKDLGITVDGFDPETNTVYEFLGDFWHGNPEIFSPAEKNWVNHKKFGDLYKATKKREKLIQRYGYNLITIWENDFNRIKGD